MKRIYYIILSVLTVLFASCADDPIGVSSGDSSDNSAPGKISGIRHEADHGLLTFYWSAPTDADYFYTDITYKVDNKEYSKKVSFHNDSTTIDGFPSASTYEFIFYAVDESGNRSAGESYSASPLEPPHLMVAQTIDIVSNDYGGVLVSWKNESGKKVDVEVSYVGDTEGLLTRTFSPDASVVDNKDNEVKTDLAIPDDNKTFTVVVYDAKGNVTPKKTFNVPVYEYMDIPRDNWEFPGYDANSRYETIGYSSQATNEANDTYPTNGHVVAMIDDDANTFWHASWSSPNTDYPHWFIIDMHQSVLIREVELQRRQGNGGTAKGFRLYTCKDVTVDQNDPDNGYPWEDQGEFEFDPTINDAQKIKVLTSPTARYVKMYFDITHKGTQNYAMFAKFAVWGQRESD
ncbi:MAG: DUF4959 domain-containing protein [Bacteroidales bacterium]|jgi:hypothetical protein|nr:DUF4959 domain-containing protein [Bacteroidales bacterium]